MIWLWLLLTGPASAQTASPAPSAAAAAGGVVRSKEWVVRRKPHREEEFIGDVSYRSGPDHFNSDWALYRAETQAWQARGRIRMQRGLKSGDIVVANGEAAQYDQKMKRGSLVGAHGGPVTFERIVSTGSPDFGSARRLDWTGRQSARLTGGVHIWGPRIELWGQEAAYTAGVVSTAAAPSARGEEGTLAVSGGRPVLRLLQGDWTGAVQADRLTGKQNPDRLYADGKARGWIRFKEKLSSIMK